MILAIFLIAVICGSLFVLLRLNLGSLLGALGQANFQFFLIAFLVYLFTIVNLANRWHIALLATGHSVNIRDLWLAIHGSIFINNLTPMTYAGGDPIARVYILRKAHKIPYTAGTASILCEYMLELPVSLSMVFIGALLILVKSTMGKLLTLSLWAATLLGFFYLIVFFFPRRKAQRFAVRSIMRIRRFFKREVPRRKVHSDVEKFYRGAHLITGHKKTAVTMLLYSVILWAFALGRLLFVFLALGFRPSVPLLLLGATLPPVAGVVPLLPAGLGLVDAAYVSIFTLLGVPFGIAVLATFLERLIMLVLGTIIGAAAISYLGVGVWSRGLKRKTKR